MAWKVSWWGDHGLIYASILGATLDTETKNTKRWFHEGLFMFTQEMEAYVHKTKDFNTVPSSDPVE